MQRFEITGPDGKKYEVSAPPGASEAQVLDYFKSQLGTDGAPNLPRQPKGEGSGSVVKNIAVGAARGVRDVVDTGAEYLPRGLSKVASGFGAFPNRVSEGLASEADRVAEINNAGRAEFDAAYGDSFAASGGRILGNMVGTGPIVGAAGAGLRGVAAGANALGGSRIAALLADAGRSVGSYGMTGGGVPMRVAGGAAAGALSSAAVDPDDALKGAAVGGVMVPAVAGLGKAGQVAGQMIRPFTKSGQQGIVDDLIRASANDPQAVANRLANPPKTIAPPTFAEVANDPGISGALRTLQSMRPEFAAELAATQSRQNTARFGAFYDAAGDAGRISQLEAARKAATEPLLDAARNNASDVGTKGVWMAAKDLGSGPLAQRSAVMNALEKAAKPFKEVRDGDPVWQLKIPFDKAWGARQNMDDIARGLDPDVNDRAAKAAGFGLGMLRERLSTAMEKAAPGFKQYSQEYAKLSEPIDAARTLQDLLKSASTGSRDMATNPVLSGAQLDRALKSMDAKDWAKLSTEQKELVATLANELTASARALTLGKAVGSNTTQNINSIGELPAIVRMASGFALPGSGSLLSKAGEFLTSGARDNIQNRMSAAFLDPSIAAQAFAPPPLTFAQKLPQGVRRALPYAGGSLVVGMPSVALSGRE